MTPRERISRLEQLLERVQRNAAKPRIQPAAARGPEATPAGGRAVHAPPAAATPVAAGPSVPVRSYAAPPVPQPPPVAPERPPIAEPQARVAMPDVAPPPVSTVQSRPASMPPEELNDDDLLDVTTLPPAAAGAEQQAPAAEAAPNVSVEIEQVSVEVDVGEEEDEEQPPASSRRFKVTESLEEAITGEAQLEGEREVPVHTPPPESGPQEAAVPMPAGLEAPGIPDVDQLEADLMGPPSMGPTAEQLGETIELEAPRGPELEIDVGSPAPNPAAAEAPVEELEVTLPRARLPSGMYGVPAPAPEVSTPPDALPTLQVTPAAATPERTQRPQHGATDVAVVALAPAAAPKNFVELLDASLRL